MGTIDFLFHTEGCCGTARFRYSQVHKDEIVWPRFKPKHTYLEVYALKPLHYAINKLIYPD